MTTGSGSGQNAAALNARFMAHALSLGARGLGQVWPNPAVGCVIVDASGRVIGRGGTRPGGRPHAETEALAEARRVAPDRLPGATAYVTLEPCAHTGKTPPCVDALIAARIGRVVSALEDPDTRVSGLGHARLREAGIAVTVGVMETEARRAHEGYLKRRRSGRPMLTLKLASTLDGRIATASGESQWITGGPARDRAHLLRATHDAILVGIGTALADDPRLDVRLPGLADRSPVRVVADSRARLPLSSGLAQSARSGPPVWLVHGPKADAGRVASLAAVGVETIAAPTAPSGRLDVAGALEALGARGISRVFCEGGGGLAASLLAADQVDRLVWCSAGLAIGADGVAAVAERALDRLADARRFRLESVAPVGDDVWMEWRAA